MNRNQIDQPFVEGVVNSLPPDVQDYVKHNCEFTIVTCDSGGLALSRDQHKKPYMIIYCESGNPSWNPIHVVAHEIAHTFLKHSCNQQQADQQQQEKDAEAQVRLWKLHTDQIVP